MRPRPLRSELPVLFGEVVETKQGPNRDFLWADEHQHMMFLDVPTLLRTQIGHIKMYCNKAIAVPLRQALDNVVERGLVAQLKSYDGCFCIRRQRGDLLRLSVHSWGMAVDFNADTNGLGSDGNMSPELVACFEDVGFVWGGRWERKDPMHFQFVEED